MVLRPVTVTRAGHRRAVQQGQIGKGAEGCSGEEEDEEGRGREAEEKGCGEL